MVFGYNPQAQPLTDEEIAQITLNETSYKHRLAGLDACDEVLVGGTDADWLFTLGREDIIASMCEIVRSLGKRPHLICHYASAVLPKADAIGLNVGKYFAPINKEWAWLDKEEAIEAVRHAQKPVIAFMAFACGHLSAKMEDAATWLRDTCQVSGIMYGTTKPAHAYETAKMLTHLL